MSTEDATTPARLAELAALTETFWSDLFRRDFDAVGAWFSPDGNYRDIPAPEEGAFGPAEVAARLRLGIEPLEKYEHVPGWNIVSQRDTTMTEHVERWTWSTGETVELPFVSVIVFNDQNQITRWWDYWDLGTLMNAAPGAWVEHIMVGYK
jgi:limonene-1,2-epoxide hydrolase